jgi:hypothetical protein
VPNNDYPNRVAGYQHLEVDVRDKRKPLYGIQSGVSIDYVLNVFQESSDSALPFASQRTMLQEWVNGQGYLELVKSPFMSETIMQENQQDETVGMEPVQGTDLRQFQPATVPVNYITSSMAIHQRRMQDTSDHMFNLIWSSVGVFEKNRHGKYRCPAKNWTTD